MKPKMISLIKLLSVVTILLMFTASSRVAAHGDEEQLVMDHGAMHAPDQCDTPTQNLTISVVGQDLQYDKTDYTVDKNTCYTFTFKNPSGIEHDMTIEEVEGEIGFVHLHVLNATVGPHGDGSVSQNVLTPDKDVTYRIFCTIPGHDVAGMHSNLIVGQGSPDTSSTGSALPGFGIFTIFASAITLALFERQRKIHY